MSDYIPADDGGALTWLTAFSGGISANPGLYQLAATDATAIASAVAAYDSAYFAANDPSSRTTAQVSLKDQTLNTAKQICRQYAILIKFNAGISDQAKLDIGVRPVNENKDPIEPPSTSPLLNIIGATPGSMTLRYADSTTPASRGKPAGVANLQLFLAVADEPVETESSGVFFGAFTKNPIGVAFDETSDGKVATFFARWSNAKGEAGPWSLPISMRIAA